MVLEAHLHDFGIDVVASEGEYQVYPANPGIHLIDQFECYGHIFLRGMFPGAH